MSPRTQQQWAEMRLNASEKIISAALDVFKQKGFHRASMEEIAKQAEVSKGLAYNYFRSKEHLLAAVMERRFNEDEGLIQGIDEISGALNKLATILDRLFDEVKKDTMLYKFYLTVFLQPDAPEAIRRIGNTSEKIRRQWAKIFEVHRAIFSELGVADPKAEVIYFRSLTTGIVAEYVMEPKNYPLEKMKAHVLHMYGMKKGGGD
jgi:AcrR family transcriptional regulator